MKKRRIVITVILVVVVMPVTTLCIAEYVACSRNHAVESAWDDWVGHRSGPPPWETPSHNLERYTDASLSVKTKSGLTTQLMGYRDTDGNTVISPRFIACARNFYSGLAWANDASGKSGYISPDGEWQIVVPGQVRGDFIGGVGQFWVRDEHGFVVEGLVDRQGNVVLLPEYSWIDYPHDGFVLTRKRNWLGNVAYGINVDLTADVIPDLCIFGRTQIFDTRGNRIDPATISRRR